MWEPVTVGTFQWWRRYEFEGWTSGGPGYSSDIDKPHIDNINPRSMLERYLRLAVKLRIPREERAAFAADFDKFRRRVSANYDISTDPNRPLRSEERNWRSRHGRGGYDVFSSLHDGTLLFIDGTAIYARDRRLAKVKNFLRRYLRREPTDKEVDWTIYLYFGSDAMSSNQSFAGYLFAQGMQDSFYNRLGKRQERGLAYSAFRQRQERGLASWTPGNLRNVPIDYMPRIQRSQLRIRTRNPDTGAVTYYEPGTNNQTNNRHRNAVAYTRNKPAVKRNQNRNKTNTAKRIQWKENTVNNMPEDHIAGHNFSNGQKAVKYTYGRVSRYLLPQSFRNQARMTMTGAYNKPGSFTMFQNPFTRANVKRANISFVILKNKNQGRATKLKTQAAKKIQTARRKQVKKRVSTAASKRKRSPK
jgi:hypothetical protein